MIEIRRIEATDPLYRQECALRERVLLSNVGLDMASFQEAFPGIESRFEHFVAVFDHPQGERVIGCALLLSNYPEPGVGKLMQMAVDEQRQGEGIGRRLVIALEERAFGELGLQELFCHAREGVYEFYGRLGWAIDSEEFSEVGIPHRRMAIRAER
ncbi:MAG: GNAT family N-acetyltransferase [Phycisphaeraceae bacterium]|nr:GNAT family N-acetyltransferase [Phycisphaeraceae bacterium]